MAERRDEVVGRRAVLLVSDPYRGIHLNIMRAIVNQSVLALALLYGARAATRSRDPYLALASE